VNGGFPLLFAAAEKPPAPCTKIPRPLDTMEAERPPATPRHARNALRRLRIFSQMNRKHNGCQGGILGGPRRIRRLSGSASARRAGLVVRLHANIFTSHRESCPLPANAPPGGGVNCMAPARRRLLLARDSHFAISSPLRLRRRARFGPRAAVSSTNRRRATWSIRK